MTDLLHWYARAHGPRAYRVVRAALEGELDASRADAATEPTPTDDELAPPVEERR